MRSSIPLSEREGYISHRILVENVAENRVLRGVRCVKLDMLLLYKITTLV
jgi:hypothetical protein